MRKTRGLTRSVIARIVPAFSGAVAPLEYNDDAQALGLHPGLQRAELSLQTAQFRFVLFATQFIRIVDCLLVFSSH